MSVRDSISRNARGILVACTVGAALVGALGLAFGQAAVAAGGLVASTAFFGGFALYLIVSERRRHESAEDELQAQATFLESLVDSIGAVSSTLDANEILERTCDEARRLFDAKTARILPAGRGGVPAEAQSGGERMIVPLAVHGERLGDLELSRAEPFHRWDHMRATVLADFAARAVENSRLLAEARDREAERERLTERLITAEQDERRRLSLFLHDGPLQSMSGIALMHDAAIAAIEDGRPEDAEKVMRNSLEKERDTIRVLRDLSFAIEPLVLRDAGFFAAVRALGDQIEGTHRITVLTDVEAGERLGEKTQVALYQIIRESLNQAVRRRPLKIEVAVREREDGGFETEIADDGVEERRRASIEAIDERVKILNGRLSIDSGEHGGTLVRVVVPPYVAAARGG
ncbi:MAG TPA: histidine kinase [Gaiellaceae bacterium]|nr:histidine kinase [Gaiellaceae bacterium]